MPNRNLQESICSSESLSRLTSWGAEVLFYRLMAQADDFGRFDGRPSVIRSRCYQTQLRRVREREVEMWLADLEAAGIVQCYRVDDRPYLLFPNWPKYQRIRAEKSKYPDPPEGVGGQSLSTADNGGQARTSAPVIVTGFRSPEAKAKSSSGDGDARAREGDDDDGALTEPDGEGDGVQAEALAEVVATFDERFGVTTKAEQDELRAMVAGHGAAHVERAMHEAGLARAEHPIRYMRRVLRSLAEGDVGQAPTNGHGRSRRAKAGEENRRKNAAFKPVEITPEEQNRRYQEWLRSEQAAAAAT